MSEDSEHTAVEEEKIAPLSHRRILILTAATAILGSLLALWFVSKQFAAGVLIGGILSFVNYYWLKFSLKKIFEQVGVEEKPRFLGFRYALRYFILGLILTIVFLTKTIPVVAVIAGLMSFALAIVFEGFIQIFLSFYKPKEI